jgi:ribosomal protein S14
MISFKIKDKKQRALFRSSENFKRVNKFLFVNFLNNEEYSSDLKKSSLYSSICNSRRSMSSKSKVRISNRCVLTNRGRSTLRSHGLSRIAMRELVQFGVLPGYSKAVW